MRCLALAESHQLAVAAADDEDPGAGGHALLHLASNPLDQLAVTEAGAGLDSGDRRCFRLQLANLLLDRLHPCEEVGAVEIGTGAESDAFVPAYRGAVRSLSRLRPAVSRTTSCSRSAPARA